MKMLINIETKQHLYWSYFFKSFL